MRYFDHFDMLAPYYDQVIRQPDQPPIHDMLKLPFAGRLLDAGGGTGRVSAALANETTSVFIMDASLPMLQQATNKACCQTVAGATEQPPFLEATFDRIIVVDAFHHLKDQQASLLRLWHLLAAGGRLIVEEPDIDHWGVKLVALLEKIALMRSHFWPAQQVAQVLQMAGASVQIKREGHSYWVLADKE